MARLNDLGKGKLEAPKLRPEIIIIRKDHNYRDMNSAATRQYVEWLKDSIRLEGVKKPIDVIYDGGKVYLEAGECRLTAAQELRKEGLDIWIPALPVKGDEAELLARSILDNSALPPTLLEFGVAARRLQKHGWEPTAIAKYVPLTVASDSKKALKFVKDALELDSAAEPVKRAVRDGVDGVKVSPAFAVAVNKKNPLTAPQIVEDAAKDAKKRGKTEVKRHKGAGKATRAKEAAETRHRSLEKIGDQMAEEILSEPVNQKKLEKLANEWLAARRA